MLSTKLSPDVLERHFPPWSMIATTLALSFMTSPTFITFLAGTIDRIPSTYSEPLTGTKKAIQSSSVYVS